MAEKSTFLDENASADDNIFRECFDKVRAFESEMLKQEEQMSELRHQRENLTISGTSDTKVEAENSYQRLESMFGDLRTKLSKSLNFMGFRGKYLDFNEEFEEVHSLLSKQLTAASSEDYGKDLADVQRLIDNFQFTREENEKLQQRIAFFSSQSEQQRLFDLEIYGVRIASQIQEIHTLCKDVMELSSARMDALMGAKTVHSFDKAVDDMVETMQEKITQVDHRQTQLEEEVDQEMEADHHQKVTVLQSGYEGIQEEVT